jgi:hypothetical protein
MLALYISLLYYMAYTINDYVNLIIYKFQLNINNYFETNTFVFVIQQIFVGQHQTSGLCALFLTSKVP